MNIPNIFRADRYLRSTIVLGIDLGVSFIATLTMLLVANFLGVNVASDTDFAATWLIGSLLASLIAFGITRSYSIVIRHSTLREFARFVDASVGKELLLSAITAAALLGDTSVKVWTCMVVLDFMITVSFLVLVRVMMLIIYDHYIQLNPSVEEESTSRRRVLIYGEKEKSLALAVRLRNSTHYEVVGYIVAGDNGGRLLSGLPVYGAREHGTLLKLRKNLKIGGILFARPDDVREEKDGIIMEASECGLKLYIAPTIDELGANGAIRGGVRDININDILGRSEIDIEEDEVRRTFEGKVVMVTGAAGSIGSELCRQLARMNVSRLIMFDNAETPLHNVRLEFEDCFKWLEFVPVIGDVRHVQRLDFVFRKYRPDVVFHAAAYKHVPLMEENPCEAVRVNVVGSRNVADKCVEYGVEKMVMVSTDKAVNPTNIMGCTKRLAEIYVQSLGLAIQHGDIVGTTRFVTTRFGNVLGSNGSVIPRFMEQIAAGGPVTVTHPEIRRFFMTIPEACRLVMEAATMATDTNIFAFDMGTPVKIADLASRMIHLAGFEVGTDIEIKFTGLRPGEKLYEEVLATEENTVPTDHERIFKAKVRESSYEEASETIRRLNDLAIAVSIPDMVRLMKRAVPEFKSRHSEFEIYDKEAAEKALEN